MRDELRATPTGLVAVSAVSALATVTWVVLARRLWAGGRWTAFSRPRLLVPVLVVLLGAGTWSYLCWQYVGFTPRRTEKAFPGDRLLLVTLVYGVLLLGVALVLLTARRIRAFAPMPRPRPWAAAAAFTGAVSAAAAVALAAGAVVAVGGEHTRIDATTAAAVPAPPVPTDPNRVARRWSEGRYVHAVAAGAGVVVSSIHTGTIIALDGRTGVERWHYRRSDSTPLALVAVEGGNGVVASFSGRLHAFDAFTGQLWWREEAETADIPEDDVQWPLLAAGSTVIRMRQNPDAPEPEFVGRDARSGELRWRYSLPSECGAWPDTTIATTALVHVLGDDCPWGETTVALYATTGQELWRTPPESDVYVRDGVLVRPVTPGELTHVLDPRTGRPMGTITDGSVTGGTAAGEVLVYFVEGGNDRPVERSGWALADLGAPAPRWQALHPPMGDEGAAFLADTIAVVQQTRACPAGDGLVLVLLDKADGANRRSFACDDLPRSHAIRSGSTVWPAPGALVVQGARELVALGRPGSSPEPR